MTDELNLDAPARAEDGFDLVDAYRRSQPRRPQPKLRLADRYAANRDVPIDIEALLREHAEIVRVDMPPALDVDGIVVGLDGHLSQPRVILNGGRYYGPRVRFTMAHELAHIVLPWHVGTIACTTRPGIGSADYWPAQLEAEANRFAARLLIPQDWLLNEVVPLQDGEEMLRRLETAETSALPSLIRLSRELPYGWMLALVGQADEPARVFRSPGSFMPPVVEDAPALDDRVSDSAGEVSFARRTVLWWNWAPAVPRYPRLPPLSAKARRPVADQRRDQLRNVATAHLRAALAARGRGDDELAHFAGVTGAVNGNVPIRSAAAIYCALRQRFSDPAEHGDVIYEGDFQMYLCARAWQWSDTPAQGADIAE